MTTPFTSIAVSTTTPEKLTQATALAQQLGLPLVDNNTTDYDFLLLYTDQHLEIRPINQPTLGSVYSDFLAGQLGYRRKHTFIANELLAKAVGVKGNKNLQVIDATAGLGRDSFILACLGCHVTMLERSPILTALLKDGLQRFMTATEGHDIPILELHQADAIDYLRQLTPEQFPDVIYLDPMYPHRTKTALVKKEMRVIREIVGSDPDADALLALAMLRAKKRVVVKRPKLAAALNKQKPDYCYVGKQQRFDVYRGLEN